MAKIRVLRLLEYIYPDVEHMELDMARWQVQQGSIRFGPNPTVIKSVVLPLEVLAKVPVRGCPVCGSTDTYSAGDETGCLQCRLDNTLDRGSKNRPRTQDEIMREAAGEETPTPAEALRRLHPPEWQLKHDDVRGTSGG